MINMNAKEFNELIKLRNTTNEKMQELYEYSFPIIVLHIERKYGVIPGDDVAQDFFVAIMEHGVNREVRHPAAWMRKVAERIYLRKYVNPHEVSNVEIFESVAYEMEYSDVFGDYQHLADKLEEKEYDFLYRYVVERYTLREIGQMLGISEKAAKQRLYRIRNKLKKFEKL